MSIWPGRARRTVGWRYCAAWAGWRFFTAETALSALHWGLPAAVLVLAALIVKLGMMPELQANRLMREL